MKKRILSFLFVCFNVLFVFAQQTVVKGVVKDMLTNQPIDGVSVSFENSELIIYTDDMGFFQFSAAVPLGEQMLSLSKVGYLNARYPVIVNEGQTLNI